jgi:hypothetical protein
MISLVRLAASILFTVEKVPTQAAHKTNDDIDRILFILDNKAPLVVLRLFADFFLSQK